MSKLPTNEFKTLNVNLEIFEVLEKNKLLSYENIVFEHPTLCYNLDGLNDPTRSGEGYEKYFIVFKAREFIQVTHPFFKNSSRLAMLPFTNLALNSLKLRLFSGSSDKTKVSIKSPSDDPYMYVIRNDFVDTVIENIQRIKLLNEGIRNEVFEQYMILLGIYLMDVFGTTLFDIMFFKKTDRQAQFMHLMEAKKFHKSSIKELAELSNMSVSKFKMVFFELYQDTPINWFRNQKLEYAAKLLKEKKHSIDQIAFSIGYLNTSNFIRAFKAKFGTTPKKYLNKDRKIDLKHSSGLGM